MRAIFSRGARCSPARVGPARPASSRSGRAHSSRRVINGRLVPQAAAPAWTNLPAAGRSPVRRRAGLATACRRVNDGSRRCAATTARPGFPTASSSATAALATCGLEPGDRNRADVAGAARAESGPGPARRTGIDAGALPRRGERAVQRIRIFSTDCELDAGGRSIHWLDQRQRRRLGPAAEHLRRQRRGEVRHLTDSAVAAIAMHKDEAADAALERLLGRDNPEFVRKKVTFWLGTTRGRRGFEAVRKIAHDDPSEDVRKSAMFGAVAEQRRRGAPGADPLRAPGRQRQSARRSDLLARAEGGRARRDGNHRRRSRTTPTPT